MGLLLLRYGEIALKGHNRDYFMRKLRGNVRRCLRDNGVSGRVWQDTQRIFVETDQIEDASQAVRRVFGVVSLSVVHSVPAHLDAIVDRAVQIAQDSGIHAARSFRVESRRADKTFAHTSPEIDRIAGAAVVEATGARVDLSRSADLAIGIEVHRSQALLFGQTIAGPGGFPVGSQGRVVALLSSGIDSPVAAWLMMKRGCAVIPVHFSVSKAQTEQVEALVHVLNQYAYGWPLRPIILSHQELVGRTLDNLRELHAERWSCLFCKRAMLAKAAEIAEEKGACAIVTGDSLGQVASQTLPNLEAISFGISKPILRPLIAYDKTEIMARARSIGTYEVSIRRETCCPFLPRDPLTQATLPKLRALLHEMEPCVGQGITPDGATGPAAYESGPEQAEDHVEPEGRPTPWPDQKGGLHG